MSGKHNGDFKSGQDIAVLIGECTEGHASADHYLMDKISTVDQIPKWPVDILPPDRAVIFEVRILGYPAEMPKLGSMWQGSGSILDVEET